MGFFRVEIRYTSTYVEKNQTDVSKPGLISYLFNFPATLFLVQSYGLYVVDARGGKFITTRPTCYVSKHTVVYDEGE
jgi:hypothetical protein